MFNAVICVVLALGTPTTSWRTHTLNLWEHINFQGVSISVTESQLDKCTTLTPSWQNRVSSCNSYEDCYEFYTQEDCQGSAVYLYPGIDGFSNTHNVGLTDNIKSFRLCDLDESDGYCRSRRRRSAEIPFLTRDPKTGRNNEETRNRTKSSVPPRRSTRSLNPNRPEYSFWDYLFGRYGRSYRDEFLRRARQCWFIRWDFIPGVSGSPGRQYQYALQWVMDQVNAGSFSREDLLEMRQRAGLVVQNRADENQRHASTSNARSMAIHEQIENVWREVVNVLDTKIPQTDDYDELG